MGYFPSKKELSLIFYGGPIALIKTKRNRLEPEKMYLMGDYFATPYGIYHLDPQVTYRFSKQLIGLFHWNNCYLPEKVINKIYRLYFRKEFYKLRTYLKFIYPECFKTLKAAKEVEKEEKEEFKTIYDVFQRVVDKTRHNTIDIDTEKYLPWYRAYNPISIKRLNEVSFEGKEAIKSLNPSFPKPKLSMVVAVIVGLVVLAIAQNAPEWIRQVRAEWEKTFGGFIFPYVIDVLNSFK